jgi:tetratricopeptide (TPR) repeat protein
MPFPCLSSGCKIAPSHSEVKVDVWNFAPRLRPMRRKSKLALLLCVSLLVGVFAAGCSRDPNVRKQKFLEQGNRDFYNGKYPEAAISYGRALQIDPHFVEARYKLAQCYEREGSWAQAFQELNRTVDLQPENWPAQLDIARLLLSGRKPQDAKDRALLILRSNPKHAEAQLLLSEADLALGNLKDALQEAREATEMAPEHSASFINLALIQARTGAISEAETSLKKAESLDPTSITPLLALGNLYQQQKRWTDAEKQFQAAIALAPKNPMPRAALASLYLSQGQEPLAEKTLMDAKQQLGDNSAAYRLLGDYYLSRGENAKALTEFGALSAQYKNDLSVQKTYVQLLIMNRRIDEAGKFTDELLKKTPQDAEVLILKGQIQLQQKNFDESIQTLQLARKNAPDNAYCHYQLGLAYKGKGDTQQAQSEWREAVRLRPALVEAWLALGASATQQGDWRILEEVSNQVKKYSPNRIEAYLDHATARINQGDALGAEADLIRVQQLAPQSALPYAKLGELRLAQRRIPDAEKLFHQALSHDPGSMEALRGMVQVSLLQNKPADAMNLVRQQIAQNPNNPGLYVLQTELFLRAKDSDQALASITRAVELDKNNASTLALLAQIQSVKGLSDRAVTNYQRAIELAPNDPRLHFTLGSLYESMGNWQQAQISYQKALSIQPENALAANNLAYLMLEHGGSPNGALTLAQTARRGLPNLPNSADTLGWAYYNNGAYSVAAPLFEDAVKKVPDNQAYRYHLGLTYKKLNDPSRAKSELEKVIALNPKSPIAEEARRALTDLTGG